MQWAFFAHSCERAPAPITRNGTQHTRMSNLHLRTISTLLITCHHKVSETNEFGPPVPNQMGRRHWLSFSRFAVYNAKQVLAGTVSCLPTDSGDKTHGGLATVHLRFSQITRVTKVISTDELLLLFLVWLTLLGSMHRANIQPKSKLVHWKYCA